MNSAVKAGLALTLCAALGGCGGVKWPEGARSAARQLPQGVSGALVRATDPEETVTGVRQYKMGPGDVFTATLRGSGVTLATITVGEDGRADLPFGGNRYVAGETLEQLETFLTYKREKETRDPTAVDVAFVNVRDVYLIGEVKRAGPIAYKPGLTLGEALKLRGGATHKAEARTVWIKPRHTEAEIEAPFDPALPLLPGDMVRLRERYF